MRNFPYLTETTSDRHKIIMLCTVFIFVFAPIAISQVASDPCGDLKQCLLDFESETFFWRKLKSPPEENVWTATWTGMCDSLPQRGACLQESSCRNETLLRRANISEKQADKLCSTRGRKFFERIRGNECIGNTSVAKEDDQNSKSCIVGNGLTNITNQVDCNHARGAFRCISKFMNERCGPLFRWMTDQMWLIGFKQTFPYCDPPRTSKFPEK